MDADLISYKTMVATQFSAYWAFGSMCAAIVGVAATLLTLRYARKALDTWKQQEALKIKIDFKSAAIELLHAIDAMPEQWSYVQVNIARSAIDRDEINTSAVKTKVGIFYLKQDMAAANTIAIKRWMMCEQLLEGTEVAASWKQFQKRYYHYAMKGGNKSEILPVLHRVVDRMVIF
ncbi:hypothetical protein [Mixta calida]|uniref:hypothetical protein n=1 Tax=Mixta calida TaxID=665913 RepID=UPI0028A90DA1|nr:hypothetical protein [Mixta calida]